MHAMDWEVFDKIRDAMAAMNERDSIDTGCGPAGREYWVRVNGAEYFVTVRRSDRQLAIDERVAQQADR